MKILLYTPFENLILEHNNIVYYYIFLNDIIRNKVKGNCEGSNEIVRSLHTQIFFREKLSLSYIALKKVS